MENKLKELDIKALHEEILRKCKKKIDFLASHDEAEDEHQEDNLQKEDIPSIKTDKIEEEELPFEDILAEKRRKYTAKEDFVYSLYNNILAIFVAEWDGYPLRKKLLAKKLSRNDTEALEEESEKLGYCNNNNDSFIKREEEKKDEKLIPPSKLSLPDEFANIKFYNKNSYRGRISRKMMEGEGTYRWHNGIQYKGQFECNKIQGRGILEWNNNCWYEGDFVNGFRHGKGIMVDRENNRMYIGQWHMNHKHMEKDKIKLKHKQYCKRHFLK